MKSEYENTIELPHAPDAESALLACLVEYPARFGPIALECGMTADLFHIQAHRAFFGMIANRIRGQKALDPSSLKEDYRKHKPAGLTLGRINEIVNCEFSPDAWDGYMQAIRQTAAKRVLIEAAQITDESDGYDAVSAVKRATEIAQDILQGSSEVYDARTASKAFLDALIERHTAKDSGGEKTGIEAIDEHTGGMRPNELWVIGAKTSGGKSVLMLQMAAGMIQGGKRVAIFSLELGVEEVMARIISNTTGISMGEIMNPKTMTGISLKKIQRKIDELRDQRFAICDMSGLTMDQISAHCIRLKETGGIDLVVIDYLQMVSAPRVKGQNREQEVATISRQCKQLAKKLKCPVLTATQLNEAGKSRESRAIEHDADNVLLIEDLKAGDNDNQIIHFWKCRNGERGKLLSAQLQGEFQRFINIRNHTSGPYQEPGF
jgi:replicative DNA helicase